MTKLKSYELTISLALMYLWDGIQESNYLIICVQNRDGIETRGWGGGRGVGGGKRL